MPENAKPKMPKQKQKLTIMINCKEHLKRGSLLASALMLAACQMTNTAAMNEARTNGTQMGETEWICSAFSPMSWSAKDTIETRTQIYEYNEVWDEFCGSEWEDGLSQ